MDTPFPLNLEGAIAAEGRRGARLLFEEAARVLDDKAVLAADGVRSRTEPRWVATTVGRTRIHRYRVKNRTGSYHPLDRMLGLTRAESSPALRELICRLAEAVSVRRVAEICSLATGEDISTVLVWRVVHNAASVAPEEPQPPP